MPKGYRIAFIVLSYLHFVVVVFKRFFFYQPSLLNMNIFLNRSILPIDGTLTGITTPGQSGPGNNGNEGILLTDRALEVEFHYQMQFSVIPKIRHFRWVFTLIPHTQEGYAVYILKPANRA